LIKSEYDAGIFESERGLFLEFKILLPECILCGRLLFIFVLCPLVEPLCILILAHMLNALEAIDAAILGGLDSRVDASSFTDRPVDQRVDANVLEAVDFETLGSSFVLLHKVFAHLVGSDAPSNDVAGDQIQFEAGEGNGQLRIFRRVSVGIVSAACELSIDFLNFSGNFQQFFVLHDCLLE